ncbi:hypothetical protein R3I94_006640 [Phoxinus phoxinus]
MLSASARTFLGFNGTLAAFQAPHHEHDACWTSQHILKKSKDDLHKVLICKEEPVQSKWWSMAVSGIIQRHLWIFLMASCKL